MGPPPSMGSLSHQVVATHIEDAEVGALGYYVAQAAGEKCDLLLRIVGRFSLLMLLAPAYVQQAQRSQPCVRRLAASGTC